jgi:hypothetical protein
MINGNRKGERGMGDRGRGIGERGKDKVERGWRNGKIERNKEREKQRRKTKE